MDRKVSQKGQTLVVDSLGGGIKEYFSVEKGKRRDIVYGYGDAREKDGCMGDVLSPFPGRMANDSYEWQGQRYEVADELKLNGRALHAFVDQVEWELSATDNTINAKYQTRHFFDEKGFPFDLEYNIEYSLNDGLTVKTVVSNMGQNEAPFGIGCHPYCAVGDKVDEMEWEVAARKVVEFDENLKPTGKLLNIEETDLDFRKNSAIGDKVIDNCFFGLERDENGIFSSVLSNPETGEKITIWQDGAYPYFQTYSSDTIKPTNYRKAMALEPQTCCGFAINMPELGLITLKPGEKFVGTWGISFQ